MENKLDKQGSLLAAIGSEAARIVGGDPDGLYIYGEVDDGSTFGAVFKDEGNQVRYFDPSKHLCALMRQAWKLEEIDKQWLVIEYEVHGTKFDVHFTFPEEVNLKEHASERRRRALRKRYAEKPIIYPPMPERFHGSASRLKRE